MRLFIDSLNDVLIMNDAKTMISATQKDGGFPLGHPSWGRDLLDRHDKASLNWPTLMLLYQLNATGNDHPAHSQHRIDTRMIQRIE